ncbi:MAG: phage/plasmid primase, P4 family [Planctomycetaceae bacterium]|nr:phage/plasmid primase, P4 family [Planctomycetaceae bacterium]
MAKTKLKFRKNANPHEKLWKSLHESFVDKSSLTEEATESNTDGSSCYEYFPEDRSFHPHKLVETIKQRFSPIVFVKGVFYHFITQGFWKELDSFEIGKFAAGELGVKAKAKYVDETLKLLMYSISVNHEDFKQTPGYINLLNGMLEIDTGELKKHAPEFYSKNQLPYSFAPEAKCLKWHRFLKDIFADDKDKIITLQQWFGYCLTTETFLQQFMIFKGCGANGKSVTLSILSELVGKENICAISLTQMGKDFVLVTLKDKLVNVCGEINTSKLLDSNILKLLTGDDSITVDVKYKTPVTFKPIAKHIFSVNELPKFNDKTQALRRRAVFLTFEQTFLGDKCNKNLTQELTQELPGIFNWALEGWRKLETTKKLFEAPSCVEYRERFAEALNPVLAFVNRACRLDDKSKIKRSEIFAEYEYWHSKNIGEHPLSRPNFYERLRDDFPEIEEIRINGVDYFKGITVLEKLKKINLFKNRGN